MKKTSFEVRFFIFEATFLKRLNQTMVYLEFKIMVLPIKNQNVYLVL